MTTGRPSTPPWDPANRIPSPPFRLPASRCRSWNTDRPRTLINSRLAYTTATEHAPTKQQPSRKMPTYVASENRVAVLVESPTVETQERSASQSTSSVNDGRQWRRLESKRESEERKRYRRIPYPFRGIAKSYFFCYPIKKKKSRFFCH